MYNFKYTCSVYLNCKYESFRQNPLSQFRNAPLAAELCTYNIQLTTLSNDIVLDLISFLSQASVLALSYLPVANLVAS
jgi:hypothetical protein